MPTRIGYVCGYCGSREVLLDAWAKWDVEAREWVLNDTLTDAFCAECDGQTGLTEI